MSYTESIEIFGAREHNLKNIDIKIPRNKLVVITGLSGSGKSSLAFDTIYAEGQRRYIESFSAYARQFMGGMERPDVDRITGLSPVIAIEQKSTNRNPRSTVGTITEVYDFMRLLFARAGEAYSYVTGEKMVRYAEQQIIQLILDQYKDRKLVLLAPVVKGRKGHYRELFEQIRKQGYSRVRVDNELKEIVFGMKLDRYKVHDIEVVIDRIQAEESAKGRITESVRTAMKMGKGHLMILDQETNEIRSYSKFLMCPSSGISYDEPAPNLFSFNSPYGACPSCHGLGEINQVDLKKIIPDLNKSIKQGGIKPLGEYKKSWIYTQIEAIADKYGFSINEPIKNIDKDGLDAILFGTEEVLKIKDTDFAHSGFSMSFNGIVNFIQSQHQDAATEGTKQWAENFMNPVRCPECEGARLKKQALWFKVHDKNIAQLAELDIAQLSVWFAQVDQYLSDKQKMIGADVIKEIRARLKFLLNVGLDYLTLNRPTATLSGGEAQRIRLATQIGSKLRGVLYILDEPSIGLHQRDNSLLIEALQDLRDTGNSVLVVEHDKDMILAADHVIDIGPAAGVHGGRVVAQGNVKDIIHSDSLTAKYLNNHISIVIPKQRRQPNGKYLKLYKASGNNLKKVDLTIPLGLMVCVTGVSGSGKSSLISETLYPILSQHFYHSHQKPLPYKKIEGLEHLDKVIEIDQTPIGRTPRSNPATYCGVFSDIRMLFAELPEAKIRGYKPGRFSFNVKGGRCETCGGAGMQVIEMNFLPDVYVHCPTCQGKRYNRETLEVRYKGKSISDVLEMTIDDAVHFFEGIPSILHKIKTLQDVGLGYIKLGQQSTTLSGGEAQRVKLATELSKRDTGKTFYILDEPTTGLHFEDIRILLDVLQKLVNKGNTVLVIEHNMDIIKVADYVIDIGPEGGEKGGAIVCEGTPEEIAKNKKSHTGRFLNIELKNR
ncbi:MAG: excinuclease ABC subunit UvrA [Flavobacteriales bacterium]